ncbi:MAG TPA: hypothetical protein VK464_23940 [Symbiobacteriaceae bacterium]|nr:hypothetical protein [Symbiobacteriaceae bacterium]
MTDKSAEHAVKAAVTAAKAVVDDAKRLGLTWTLRPATVIDGTNPAAVLAVYDGDTVNIAMTSLLGYLPVGARVYAMAVPPGGNFITGFAGPALCLPTENVSGVFSAGTTTSASYATLPNLVGGAAASVSIAKQLTSSKLRVDMHVTARATIVATIAKFGALVNNVDTDIALMRFDVTTREQVSGTGIIGVGLEAGTYTVTGRWLRSSGTGVMTIDTADFFSMTVAEVCD